MVRKHEWKEFEKAAREIFVKNPESTRMSMKQTTKAIEKDGTLKRKQVVFLKVTDNKQTITFETSERHALKRICSLNRWFIVRMASTSDDQLKEEATIKQKIAH